MTPECYNFVACACLCHPAGAPNRGGEWSEIDERTGQFKGRVRGVGRVAPRLPNDDGEVTGLPPLRRDFRRSSGAVEHGKAPTGCTATNKPHGIGKFGSEVWVLKKTEEQPLEAAQMKFLRHLLGITKLDKEKNQCIRQETGAQNIVQEIKQYQEKWFKHVQRMDTNRLPKQALQYKPNGRRNIGRPRKRWRDQLHLEDQGIG